MSDFCSEVKVLQESGVKVGPKQKLLRFQIRVFDCDSPARAFVTVVLSHNSKNGCAKCCQEGTYKEGTVCFSNEVGVLRSDSTFGSRLSSKAKVSILEETGFGMVLQFPLDCMHLVDLGVTKKLLKLLNHKDNIGNINKKLSFLAEYIPSEFCRAPRGLEELHNWKSTEFRQFLLYTGIFVLKDRFENYMHHIKKIVKKPNKIFQQVFLRLDERQGFKKAQRMRLN